MCLYERVVPEVIVCRQMGKWVCKGHLMSCTLVWPYVGTDLILYMVSWIDTNISSPFILEHSLSSTGKTIPDMTPLENFPLTKDPTGICQGPDFFQTTELHEVSPIRNNHSAITGGIITYVHIQQSSPCFVLHITVKRGPSRWLPLVVIAKMKLLPYFGIDIFAWQFFYINPMSLLVYQTVR